MIRQRPIAVLVEVPDSTIHPRAQAANPIIEATERSISALRMMKVMIRAMMIFSTDRTKRLTWFSTVRNAGE